jgi:hypothetical protein
LVACAHNEYALAHEGQVYPLRSAENASEVAASLHAWLDVTPSSLSNKLLRVSGNFANHGLNEFAVACYLCGAKDEAKAVLAALRGEIQETPWQWIAKNTKEEFNPAFIYDRICRELGVSF